MTQASWALATAVWRGRLVPCLEVKGALHRLAPILARLGARRVPSTEALFADWPAALRLLSRAARAARAEDRLPAGTRRGPPLMPGKVLCAGANYHAHCREMGVADTSRAAMRLFFFFKPARQAVVGEGETVRMPIGTRSFDWEVELAAVIGRTARNVTEAEALVHVAGYTVAIDFSARDLNRAPETFYKLDWVAGKAHDTCCPMGPRMIPASAVPDPQALRLSLSVNGEVKQDDTTGDMIFSLAEQIAAASRIMTLEPGDVILTGTPAGVGAPKGTFLSVGDRVEASVEGIGTLAVTITPPG